MSCIDNVVRFDSDPGRLASAVPEVYALTNLSDHDLALDARAQGRPDFEVLKAIYEWVFVPLSVWPVDRLKPSRSEAARLAW